MSDLKLLDNYTECALETMQVQSQSSESTARPLGPYSSLWHRAKIVIRASIILAALAVCGLLSVNDMMVVVIAPVLSIDMVWQLAELIILAKFQSTTRKGMNPVAHLVEDLLLWIAYVIITAWYIIHEQPVYLNSNDQQTVNARIAIIVLLILQWYVFQAFDSPKSSSRADCTCYDRFFHFSLFIRDCVEVNQRKMTKASPDALYYSPGHLREPSMTNHNADATQLDQSPEASRRASNVSSLPEYTQYPETSSSFKRYDVDVKDPEMFESKAAITHEGA